METLSAERHSGGASHLPPPAPVETSGRYSAWSKRLAARYGGKRACLHHWQGLLLYRLGALHRYARVDWRQVERVVFVCHGNICRSPYCEVRGRLLGLHTSSLGLAAVADSPANSSVAVLAGLRGVDLSGHRARPLLNAALSPGDLLVAMEPSQARQLGQLTVASAPQITLLGLWSAQPRPYLHDPYGLGPDYITTCLNFLDQGVQRIATEVRRHHAG